MTTSTLVANARARFNHHESKQYLKEKYTNMLSVAYAGSMFKVDQTLITFLGSSQHDIIVDIYDNPVKVNREEFTKLVNDTYNLVMTEWLEEYTNLSKVR